MCMRSSKDTGNASCELNLDASEAFSIMFLPLAPLISESTPKHVGSAVGRYGSTSSTLTWQCQSDGCFWEMIWFRFVQC